MTDTVTIRRELLQELRDSTDGLLMLWNATRVSGCLPMEIIKATAAVKAINATLATPVQAFQKPSLLRDCNVMYSNSSEAARAAPVQEPFCFVGSSVVKNFANQSWPYVDDVRLHKEKQGCDRIALYTTPPQPAEVGELVRAALPQKKDTAAGFDGQRTYALGWNAAIDAALAKLEGK